MKTFLKNLLFSLFCFFAFGRIAHAQTTNFSGGYSIDKQKTVFGPAPDWVLPKSYTIHQQGSNLTIVRMILDPQQREHPDTLQLKADGSTFQNYSYSGKKQNFTLKWDADQKSFILTLHSITPAGDAFSNVTETWSLGASGKTLVVERSVDQVSNGMKYMIKAYYNQE